LSFEDACVSQPPPEGFSSASHITEMKRKGLELLNEFSLRPRVNKVIKTEYSFEFTWNEQNASMAGVMDLIETLPSGGACELWPILTEQRRKKN